MAKFKSLTGSPEFDDLLREDYSGGSAANVAEDRAALVQSLQDSAEALRINFEGYTTEVRYTDRLLRFPALFGQYEMLRKTIPAIKSPDPALLYSSVTGDPGGCGYFPLNAVRWFTPPRNIAALVTAAGTDGLTAELFHFGREKRPMAAEVYLLAPGQYSFELRDAGGGTVVQPPRRLTVSGPRARIAFELPPGRLCVLRIESATPRDPAAPH